MCRSISFGKLPGSLTLPDSGFIKTGRPAFRSCTHVQNDLVQVRAVVPRIALLDANDSVLTLFIGVAIAVERKTRRVEMSKPRRQSKLPRRVGGYIPKQLRDAVIEEIVERSSQYALIEVLRLDSVSDQPLGRHSLKKLGRQVQPLLDEPKSVQDQRLRGLANGDLGLLKVLRDVIVDSLADLQFLIPATNPRWLRTLLSGRSPSSNGAGLVSSDGLISRLVMPC